MVVEGCARIVVVVVVVLVLTVGLWFSRLSAGSGMIMGDVEFGMVRR